MIDVENSDSTVGVPNVYHFGADNGYKFMVMEMLSSTLHELKEITGKNKLLPKTIAKIGLQMVNILYSIHFISFYLLYSIQRDCFSKNHR